MITTKRLSLLLGGMLGLALVSGQAMAQTSEPPQERPMMMHRGPGMGQPDPARHLGMLTRNLGLTAEQQDKIRPILDEEATRANTIANEKLTQSERRTRMQQLHRETFEKIKPLLTPEQLKKHDAMREKMQDRRKTKQGQPQTEPTAQ